MARDLANMSHSDMVERPLSLEPRKHTLDSLSLGVQGFPLRWLLFRSHFPQQRLVGTVNLNDGCCPILLLSDPEHQITATVPIAAHDILRAYSTGALDSGAMDFVRFHLEESECPYCSSVLEDQQLSEGEAAKTGLEDLRDRLLRSTAAALRKGSGA